jgi:hypothetical protein
VEHGRQLAPTQGAGPDERRLHPDLHDGERSGARRLSVVDLCALDSGSRGWGAPVRIGEGLDCDLAGRLGTHFPVWDHAVRRVDRYAESGARSTCLTTAPSQAPRSRTPPAPCGFTREDAATRRQSSPATRRKPERRQLAQPTRVAEPVHVIQDETRNRSSQDRGNRVGRHQQRKRARLFALGKPVGQVQQDSGEIACLG